MQQIRAALVEEIGLGPERIERARREFFVRRAALEAEFDVNRTPAFPMLTRAWDAAFAAPLSIAAAVVCLVGLFVWFLSRPPQVQPGEVLAHTLGSEDSLRLRGAPVHQEFQIEIRQVKPASRQRSGVLKVWYDSPAGRFASRWEGEDCQLQFAIWRPEPDREFVFNARIGDAAVPRAPRTGQAITLGELTFDEVSLEQLEAVFLQWLSNRRWEPISIASDMNVFRGRDGVEAAVETVTSPAGRPSYRITARRKTAHGTVEVVAEVDAETYKPSIELLRLSDAERVVELRMQSCRTQWLVSGMIEKAVFWPSVDIAGEPQTFADLRSPEPARGGPEPKLPETVLPPTTRELDLLEAQARYALHQAGACLGVPVRVERIDGRLVRVGGLVESNERKQDLLARLAGLSRSPLVNIDIQTVEEALQEASANTPSGAPDRPAASGHEAAGGAERLKVVATDSPIREALERYLQRTQAAGAASNREGDAPALHDLASEFSEQVISNSLANLTEAWALRRLAERYGPNAAELPPAAAALLRRMLADHSASLGKRTAAIQQQVRPLLLTLVDHSALPEIAAGGAQLVDDPGGRDWPAQSLRIFQEIESAEAVTTGLFADSGYANGARREDSSGRAAAALLQALPRLEARLRLLEKHLSGQDRETPQAGLPIEDRPARGLL
jgi:hypothetical protein